MAVEYKTLVLELLSKRQYPVLKDFVVLDIHFKMLPEDYSFENVRPIDRRLHDPVHEWRQRSSPFTLSYLVGNEHVVYVHETDRFDSDPFPIECQRVKLCRGYLDTLRNQTSKSFEEELYHFVTLLNFNVPKLASLLGFNFITCTRLLPQFIKMWVYKYDTEIVKPCVTSTSHFGPPPRDGVIPIRVLRGQLAPCTSKDTVLSLNNDVSSKLDYTWHYSDRCKAIFPLAYNPLENVLIVA